MKCPQCNAQLYLGRCPQHGETVTPQGGPTVDRALMARRYAHDPMTAETHIAQLERQVEALTDQVAAGQTVIAQLEAERDQLRHERDALWRRLHGRICGPTPQSCSCGLAQEARHAP